MNITTESHLIAALNYVALKRKADPSGLLVVVVMLPWPLSLLRLLSPSPLLLLWRVCL